MNLMCKRFLNKNSASIFYFKYYYDYIIAQFTRMPYEECPSRIYIIYKEGESNVDRIVI